MIWLNPVEVEQLPQQKRPFPGIYRSWDPCNVMHLGLVTGWDGAPKKGDLL